MVLLLSTVLSTYHIVHIVSHHPLVHTAYWDITTHSHSLVYKVEVAGSSGLHSGRISLQSFLMSCVVFDSFPLTEPAL